MNEDSRVKEYFIRDAKTFDNIYDNRGGLITRIANVVFRKGMAERYRLTLELCGSGNLSVLDIGCGAARFTIPLAERGMKVLGIDYSPEMIRMADEYVKVRTKKTKKTLNVRHLCCDFLTDFGTKEKFDITLAMGVFDYLKDPAPFLKKMKEVTRGKMLLSFPAKYAIQAPIRKVWLATKDCPVYYYTRAGIRNICASAGITNYEIIPIKAGYIVRAEV